ncbi:MAG TPA: hypothetical protein VF398_00130 [bacterium]
MIRRLFDYTKRWIFAIVLWAFFLTSLLGCSRGRAKFEDLPVPEVSAIFSRVQANRAALKDFEGAGLLEVSNSKMGRTIFGVKLSHVSPDHLLLSLNGAMGIHFASLLLEGDRYSVSFGMPPVQATGLLQDFDIPEDFGILLKGEDIYKVLLPLEPISSLSDSASVRKDFMSRQFCLDWSVAGQTHDLWADPYRPIFTRETILSNDGDTLVTKEMEQVSKRGGVHFPMSWNIRSGKVDEESVMRFKLRQLNINTGLAPEDLRLNPEAPIDTVEVRSGG